MYADLLAFYFTPTFLGPRFVFEFAVLPRYIWIANYITEALAQTKILGELICFNYKQQTWVKPLKRVKVTISYWLHTLYYSPTYRVP